MPPLPPAHDVLDALRQTVLPAAGGAALVFALFLGLGRWAAAVGSAVAVVVGFAAANYTFDKLDWDGTGRLVPWVPGESPRSWHHLPRVGLVLILTGLLSRWAGLLAARQFQERRWWVTNLVVWLPRAAAVAVVSGWLVPPAALAEEGWLRLALPAVMLLSWAALDGVARAGCGGQVAAYQAGICYAAGGLLLYHHWASAMEIAASAGSALFGVAVVAWATRSPADGAVPAGVAVLPGLLLAARVSQDSRIPVAAFWLVALAPLVLLPFLVPRLNRQNGPAARVTRAVLVLAPLAVALAVAAQHEQLAFEEEAW